MPTLTPVATLDPPNLQSLTLTGFLSRVETRTARVGIIGLGYVGLPLTLLFSDARFPVTGFDIDPTKVATLNRGQSYIHRIEPAHIAAARRTGFTATSDFAQIATLDAILICVPTPLHADHTPDLSFVIATVEALAPHLHPGQLVILESTTYPGTTEEIVVQTIERHDHKVLRSQTEALEGVMVAFSPEREDPGNLTTPRHDIPKVIGGVGPTATAAASALYGAVFRQTVPMSSPAAAEMTKLLENIYRSVNIALVNELRQVATAMDIDLWEVIAAAATKPFGFQPFYPGPGVGGHCIPVDPFYLTWKAKQFGVPTRFIQLAGEVNESMPVYVFQRTKDALQDRRKSLSSSKVLVLGLAYKRDVDDLRESPALTILQLLRDAGAEVRYNDPFFPAVTQGRRYNLHLTSTPLDDLAQYDCVLIVTDHTTYDFPAIVAQSRLVIDTRNATHGIASPNIVRC